MDRLIDQIRNKSFEESNLIIYQICGIKNYFMSENEKALFVSANDCYHQRACEDRVSYGDWQTPRTLAEKVCEQYFQLYGEPDIVIEPTCGLGSFVFAAIDKFPNIKEIHAIEINKDYTDNLKLNILINSLNNRSNRHSDIYIYNADFFKFDFSSILKKAVTNDMSIGIIGNPPWVTNSQQGKNRSQNIPIKTNRYGLKGIDAITGKSNFDISENIVLSLLSLVHSAKGGISLLLKNSVIRGIVEKQKTYPLNISCIKQGLINASAEFNVSVDASCFTACFNSNPSMVCSIEDFYTKEYIRDFGWVGDSFVSDTKLYRQYSDFDNHSSYIWRSGIKHDCANVLELTFDGNTYRNGFNEEVNIESDMIYPLLKSSDINKYRDDNFTFRKYIIVPQHKVGEDTSILRYSHPLTYSYLLRYKDIFLNRKSSIYNNKDPFSIFGIGLYSFKPYKIVISALYKDVNFVMVQSINGKPVMVDDTCYQLDFDSLEETENIWKALKSDEIISLLNSLIFRDSKRVITKNLLMRLDLAGLCHKKGINLTDNKLDKITAPQLPLFD